MQCPKCKKMELQDGMLSDNLSVKWCAECSGIWIPTSQYQAWQEYQRRWAQQNPEPVDQDIDFIPSPYDSRAALCPECSNYLSRAKVPFKNPFYIERCMSCGGIWCDNGEWEMLEYLGFQSEIEQMFSSAWQAKQREQNLAQKERDALVNKLGPDIADYVFQLAEVLKDHPYGDFAASYMLRRFESVKKGVPESHQEGRDK